MQNQEENKDNVPSKDWRKKARILKTDHDSYTFVDVFEQIVILVGVVSFLVGFWYVAIRLVLTIFKRGEM